MQPTGSPYLKGALCGLTAVSIWAGWSAVTRLAVTTELDAWDIAALRFGVAAVLLLPVVLRRGLLIDRLGWRGLAMLVAGAGVPAVLLAATGLRYAPAHDHGALNPGCMPLFVTAIGVLFLGERPSSARRLGLALILAAVIILVGYHEAGWSPSRTLGHALFLATSLLWAGFTLVTRQARIAPLHAAALVAVGSSVIYLPVYFVWHGAGLARLPLPDLAIQAVFQGVLVTVVSLVLYGRAIATLGAPGAAAFGALVPALSALFAIPVLGEWPSDPDWLAIALVSAGVYLASGGPLPRKSWRYTGPADRLGGHTSRRGSPSP